MIRKNQQHPGNKFSAAILGKTENKIKTIMTMQQTYRLTVYFPNMTRQRKQQLSVPHWVKN